MAEAPDAEWKALIALSRYGGLRCPSEHYALRWGDIDWHRGRIRVPCPNLEYREGHGYSTVPLFPEVREHLLKLFEETPDGIEYVNQIPRGPDKPSHSVRTHHSKVNGHPVAQPASQSETELMREYDWQPVCKWIGNSPAVAAKHYAMSVNLNADFDKAVGPIAEG